MTADSEPRTLAELHAVRGDEEIVRSAEAYLARVAAHEKGARAVRDDAIRRLATTYGPSEASRRACRSLSTVKAIVRGRR